MPRSYSTARRRTPTVNGAGFELEKKPLTAVLRAVVRLNDNVIYCQVPMGLLAPLHVICENFLPSMLWLLLVYMLLAFMTNICSVHVLFGARYVWDHLHRALGLHTPIRMPVLFCGV